MKKLLFLLIPLMLFSCGVRKTNKSQSDKSSTLERSVESLDLTQNDEQSDLTIQETAHTLITNNLVDETEKLEPIDASKPIEKTQEVKDGKLVTTWKNAKVDASRKTDNSTNSKTQSKQETLSDKKKIPK
jgi:hypothetical protein